jgi:cobalt-zinc-cadmium efflux system protein
MADKHDHKGENHHDHNKGGNHHHHEHKGGHHHHHHAPSLNNGSSFFIAIILNSIYIVIEFSFGIYTGSTALMADAGHNFTDVLSLVLSWGALVLSSRTPSARYSYGLRSSTILAALTNAMILLVTCGGITWEVIQRLSVQPEIPGFTVSAVAGIGILVNGISALLFIKGSDEDLNVRAAFVHLASDALLSFGVVITGFTMQLSGWYWLDSVTSLIIMLLIFVSTWDLLTDSMLFALNAVPPNVDAEAIETYLSELDGVSECHDLHIWGLSTTETALTAHLVIPDGYPGDDAVFAIEKNLLDNFSIHHCTLQIEQGTSAHGCSLTTARHKPCDHTHHEHAHDHH